MKTCDFYILKLEERSDLQISMDRLLHGGSYVNNAHFIISLTLFHKKLRDDLAQSTPKDSGGGRYTEKDKNSRDFKRADYLGGEIDKHKS